MLLKKKVPSSNELYWFPIERRCWAMFWGFVDDNLWLFLFLGQSASAGAGVSPVMSGGFAFLKKSSHPQVCLYEIKMTFAPYCTFPKCVLIYTWACWIILAFFKKMGDYVFVVIFHFLCKWMSLNFPLFLMKAVRSIWVAGWGCLWPYCFLLPLQTKQAVSEGNTGKCWDDKHSSTM